MMTITAFLNSYLLLPLQLPAPGQVVDLVQLKFREIKLAKNKE